MRQRIKIAGALVHDPGVILLDEPFNGMDPRQRMQMIELLRTLATKCSRLSNSSFAFTNPAITSRPRPDSSGPISTSTSARSFDGSRLVINMALRPPME